MRISSSPELDLTYSSVAGSVTVATSIGAIIYYTIKHAAAYDRLVTEIRDATDETSAFKPVTYAQTLEMSYLFVCQSIGINEVPLTVSL